MPETNIRSARILIVDDEQGPRESLRMILSPQHEVQAKHQGQEEKQEYLGAEDHCGYLTITD